MSTKLLEFTPRHRVRETDNRDLSAHCRYLEDRIAALLRVVEMKDAIIKMLRESRSTSKGVGL